MFVFFAFSKEENYQKKIDSIEKSFNYEIVSDVNPLCLAISKGDIE